MKSFYSTLSGKSAAKIAGATVGAIAVAVPAQAAATINCASVDADITTKNNTLKSSSSEYANLHGATAAANAAVKKANKALAAAKKAKKSAAVIKKLKKAVTKAKAKATQALAAENAWLAANLITKYTGTNTPKAVYESTLKDNWTWGTYTTVIAADKTNVYAVCTTVDETNAQSAAGVKITSDQKHTSENTYVKPVLGELVDGLFLTKSSIAGTTVLTDVLTMVAKVGGKTTEPIGAGSGASYSVQGYYYSLQAALTLAGF